MDLTRSLVAMTDRKAQPPCGPDPEPWFSPVPSVRAMAAHKCRTCPLLQPCREAGQDETWGVWGGIDRDKRHVPLPKPHHNRTRNQQEAS